MVVLLDERVWHPLKEMLLDERNFFTNENYKLLKDVQKIRNEISHPSLTIYTALENPNLSEKMKESIKNTQERLEQQNSAQGIILFFEDSLNSIRGQEIKNEFHKNNLLAFGDIKNEVEDLYFK